MNIVKSLAQSRKAWVLLIAIACVSGLAYTDASMAGRARVRQVARNSMVRRRGLEDGAHKLMLPPQTPTEHRSTGRTTAATLGAP
jgi:hypothetical protein